MNCYVVTNVELGWDNVVGVFSNDISYEDLEERFPEDKGYYIDERNIETSLSNFD